MTSLEDKDGSSKARKRITKEKLPQRSSFLDLRWCSKRGRSAPPKRIGKKKLRRFQREFHISSLRMGKGPNVQLVYFDDRLCCEDEIRLCAETALSSWNEKSFSEQGPEYELAEPLNAVHYRRRMLYHCNFTARPKLASEAENKLFFAELKSFQSLQTYGEYDLCCQFCCILGPSGCGGFTMVERLDDEIWPV